ncbi:MAG: cytochrome b [Marinagarivorans sp.]|nr:cytochrome b [Marinagarivorans sp.]
MLKNTLTNYGWLSRAVHWLSALLVIGLFALGLWMSGLSYSHEWYRTAPDLHRSFGILLAALTIIRLVWYKISPKPTPLAHYTAVERKAGIAVHHVLMLLLFVMFISGYLITTAKGDPIYFFNLMAIPSLINGVDNLEDIAGNIHEISAYSIIALVVLHIAGAFKHHFIDKDITLTRMLGVNKKD